MARGVGGGIPGNGLGQGFTSPSTFTHVLCVSGAPIGAVGGAADGRRSMQKTTFGTAMSVPHAVLCGGRTHHHPMSAATAKNRVVNAQDAMAVPNDVHRRGENERSGGHVYVRFLNGTSQLVSAKFA